MNRPLPSHITTCTPPGCRLRRALYRSGPCIHGRLSMGWSLQFDSTSSGSGELGGSHVVKTDQLWCQNIPRISLGGEPCRHSPTSRVLVVPSMISLRGSPFCGRTIQPPGVTVVRRGSLETNLAGRNGAPLNVTPLNVFWPLLVLPALAM